MVDSTAGVFGWRAARECRASRHGLTTVRMHGPGRDVANRRREPPPDGAGVAESTIQLAATAAGLIG
jgi:hypothetical protein